MPQKASAEATVRNIRRKIRRTYSAEEMICIVPEGLRGDHAAADAESVGNYFHHRLLCPLCLLSLQRLLLAREITETQWICCQSAASRTRSQRSL
jgi:hypothetical protein